MMLLCCVLLVIDPTIHPIVSNIPCLSEITQLWSQDADISFFINYHDSTHETVCEGVPDFSYNETMTKDLECYNGWTDVGVFIYFDELTLDDCEECKPPASNDENIIAYYFELPCEPICTSLEPTESPTTQAPTAQLDSMAPSSHVGSPAPTIQVGSSSPTDCYDLYGITESDIIEQTGSSEPIPEDSVKIISKDNASLTLGELNLYLLTMRNNCIRRPHGLENIDIMILTTCSNFCCFRNHATMVTRCRHQLFYQLSRQHA